MSRWPADRLDPDAYAAPGLDLTVFYGDIDPNGHLNNVAYGRFFEQSRVLTHAGLGLPVLESGRTSVLVARVCIDYLREGGFGSPLHVRVRISEVRRTSFVEEQAAWQDGQCLALSEVVLVHISDGRPVPVPDRMRAALESLRPQRSG